MVQTIVVKQPYEKTAALLKSKYNELDETGCFFAIVSTEYDGNGNAARDIFDVIDTAVKTGYTYINTIVYPACEMQQAGFNDNARYVVWLCRSRTAMKFNKDAIREKHIWKDVEWGKRAKNYNPKGKDPGNVWIPTEDDGKGNITKHILLSDQDVINRLLAMADCGDNYELHIARLKAAKTQRAREAYAVSPAVCGGRESIEGSPPAEVSGTVIFGTAENMDAVADASVDVAVTSPPYWDLKDYFKKGQIGQEPYDEYLARMETVWRQCCLKLTPKGSLWVNINIRNQGGSVIALPYDFIRICRKIGFFYKGIFIWHKSSGIPTNEKNIVDRHEYVLVFAKSEDFCVDLDVQASFSDYKNAGMNGGAFWNINRKAGSVGKKYKHPAIFPNDLVRRIVEMASPVSGMVLDPFLGSGAALIAATQCGRSFIGYEYNEGFKELMQSRFDAEAGGRGVYIEFVTEL